MSNYTPGERAVIFTHAAAKNRAEAVATYAEAIKAHGAMLHRRRLGGSLPYGDVYFEFMREVDTPCPDYSLKSALRRQLLDAHSEPVK